MKRGYDSRIFRKVLVPIIYGCQPSTAVNAAVAIAGKRSLFLAGLVGVDAGDSLSKAAVNGPEIRKQLQEISGMEAAHGRFTLRVSHELWQELIQVILEEQPDLLIMEWPCDFEALGATPNEALRQVACDMAIVRGPISRQLNKVLVAMRGGPSAELALRLGLNIAQHSSAHLTTLHFTPPVSVGQIDAPFRGIDQILRSLPDAAHIRLESSDPAQDLLRHACDYDLIVLGARAPVPNEPLVFGPTAERLLAESPNTVMIVKTRRAIPPSEHDETAGHQAISVLVDKWFAENTYHADEFSDLDRLLKLKHERGVTISLALPALNEEETVGTVIRTIKEALMDQTPLLDEMVLMDSDSTDATRQIASDLGVPVYIHQQIFPHYGARRGKGEALWKSLFVTHGDIVLWIDTDIVNIHPRFIYGLIGPLLVNPKIQFVKGFYRRPIKVGERMIAGGGGRVTELTARPLLNLFYPELSGVIQPLSGEYGGRRSILEQMPFFSGYGVEIGLLIEVFTRFGLGAIAQIDLQERIHHNQPIESLSKMSFAIIQAVIHKLENRYGRSILEDVNKTMKLIRYETRRLYLEVEEIAEQERPPMLSIPEYQKKITVVNKAEQIQ
ncbi:MAG: glucosyl-3-phosphoglycerate synthase [Anaerolineales bacterium]|nr:glucosyl-3-phosphoglycerate synthase [Anaerolineales bacterium]